jgi:hypothetical protein
MEARRAQPRAAKADCDERAVTYYTVTVRGTGIHNFRRWLKAGWRSYGLKVIESYEHTATKVSRCSTAQAARRTQERRKRKGNLMKMTKYAGASFIGQDDVRDGPIRGTIAAVGHGSFDKPVITLASGAKSSLNKTSVGTLIEAWGEESDDWIGEKVEFYAGTIPFQGVDKDAVLARALEREPGEKKKPPPKPRDESSNGGKRGDLDDDIPY